MWKQDRLANPKMRTKQKTTKKNTIKLKKKIYQCLYIELFPKHMYVY